MAEDTDQVNSNFFKNVYRTAGGYLFSLIRYSKQCHYYDNEIIVI